MSDGAFDEARGALGLPEDVVERLARAEEELGFDQPARARELCDAVLEGLAPDSPWRAAALYLRAMARDDAGRLEDLREAVACAPNAEPSWGARARLALGRALGDRDQLERAVGELAACGRPVQEASAMLTLARLELGSGHPARARHWARSIRERLSGVLHLEARRYEVHALEVLADAAPEAAEERAFLREALERAQTLELGRRRALRERLERLEARRGPFR